MMTDVYVFSSRMKNKIFGDVNGTRVVTMDTHSTLFNTIITKHLFHTKELGATTPYNDILYFPSG